MIFMRNTNKSKGFTLVELLVVMVIMGLVMTSVYGLFISSQRTGSTSEAVVDVQQNLRVAMEALVADLRMAGFLIPAGTVPVQTAPDSLAGGNLLDLNIATSTGSYARAIGASSVVIASGVAGTFTVDSGMAENFNTDDSLRIINPSMPDNSIEITAAEVTDISTDTVELTPTSDVTVNPGDMILRTTAADGASSPVQISYQLVDDPDSGDPNMMLLQREAGVGGFETVAGNINTVNFTYIPSTADIRAVRVTITAATDNTKTGLANYSGVKTRSLQTVVKIQNSSGV